MNTQKRLAAKILKCGTNRVWVDPEAIEEVSGAMTRGDVRKFIGLGMIKARPKKGVSRGRARKRALQKSKGRRRGLGSRKGKARARLTKKQKWMSKIRAQRILLREFRDSGKLNKTNYRKVYSLAKAGIFKNKAHLKTYLNESKLLKAGKKLKKPKKPEVKPKK